MSFQRLPLIWVGRKQESDKDSALPPPLRSTGAEEIHYTQPRELGDLCCRHLSSRLHLNTWHCLSAYHRSSGPTRPFINMQLVNCEPVVGKVNLALCCHWRADESLQEQGHLSNFSVRLETRFSAIISFLHFNSIHGFCVGVAKGSRLQKCLHLPEAFMGPITQLIIRPHKVWVVFFFFNFIWNQASGFMVQLPGSQEHFRLSGKARKAQCAHEKQILILQKLLPFNCNVCFEWLFSLFFLKRCYEAVLNQWWNPNAWLCHERVSDCRISSALCGLKAMTTALIIVFKMI